MQLSLSVTIAITALAALLATIYSVSAILGWAPLSVPIFLVWLAILTSTSVLLLVNGWLHWEKLTLRRRLLLILWTGVSLWYWSLAPLYLLLIAVVNEQQLAWTAFAFFWEVPVIGGGVFVAGSWWFARQFWRIGPDSLLADRQRVYRLVLWYPVMVGLLLFLVSLLGYTIGAWQIGYFADWPKGEQIKNIWNGAFVSLFPSVFFYLVVDTVLHSLRRHLRGDDASENWPMRHLRTRTAVITAIIVIGNVGLLALIAYGAFQSFALFVDRPDALQFFLRQQTLWRFGAGSILVLFMTIGVIIAVSSAITRSLRHLTMTAMRVPSEHKATAMVIHTGDEIETLSRGLAIALGRAEQEASRLSTIIESVGDGLIVTDQEERVVLINKTAQELVGWSASHIVGKRWHTVVQMTTEEGKEVIGEKPPLHRALTSGQQSHTDSYFYARNDGRRFPVSMTATALKSDGEKIGAVLVFRDITQEKVLERARDEFVSLASHQLRTPVTIIRWYLEKLRDTSTLEPQQQEYLQEISIASQRMFALVRDLLNISRLEMDRVRIEPESIDLADFLPKLMDELRPLAKKTKCELRFHQPSQALPTIPIDKSVLRTAIHSLLSNAIRYARHESGEVALGIQQDKQNYVISVWDNGIGIPEDEQDRVFQKFFRASNAAKRTAEGTGLGLYIAYLAVTEAGGSIWFESKENEGTTFYISLPPEGMRKRSGETELAIR